jgi:hypothetical protein
MVVFLVVVAYLIGAKYPDNGTMVLSKVGL